MKTKIERDTMRKLKRMTRNEKMKVSYESEFLPYTLPKRYLPDFVVTRLDGSKIYIECKGYLRPSDRTKMLRVKQENPGIDLRIVFQVDNKLNKHSKTRYSEWAKKHGFPYSINHIPNDWIV